MKGIIIDSSYFLIRKRWKWKTGYGAVMYIDEMSDTHVINCFRRLVERDIPNPWFGQSTHTWSIIFQLELRKRKIV